MKTIYRLKPIPQEDGKRVLPITFHTEEEARAAMEKMPGLYELVIDEK